MVAILRSTITVVVAIHMNTATGGKQEGGLTIIGSLRVMIITMRVNYKIECNFAFTGGSWLLVCVGAPRLNAILSSFFFPRDGENLSSI